MTDRVSIEPAVGVKVKNPCCGVLFALSLVVLSGCARSVEPDAAAVACSALTGKVLSHGIVKQATPVTAGQSMSLAGVDDKVVAPFGFCRIEATLRSEPGSEIQSLYWLPMKPSWNGKFVGLGNGFGGVIQEAHMFPALRQGFAVAATDMGHPASFPQNLAPMNGKWAYQQPVKVLDWAYRANHLTAATGKELIDAHFGQKPKRSYFHGCSDGGREALMQAGRYPDDYDGIIAGAPAAAFTDLMAHAQWNNRQAVPTQLTEEKLDRLHAEVLDRCDALDGAKDGLLESPSACRFDPEVLSCKPGDDPKRCLTGAEVEAVRATYRGPRTADGQQLSAGFSPGSEYKEGWSLWITGPTLPLVGTVKSMTGGSLLSTDFFRWMVHADPDWERERFDLDKDLPLARQRLAATINSDQLDMTPFFARNGKLMLYHGWSDAALPPMNTVRYFERLQARHADAATQQLRLFMAPGMGHCMGGPGPSVFDALDAMDRWTEGGPPPEQMVATKFDKDAAGALGQTAKVQRTRPLCAWPKVARWTGQGSIDAAENFSCQTP